MWKWDAYVLAMYLLMCAQEEEGLYVLYVLMCTREEEEGLYVLCVLTCAREEEG